MDRISVVIPFYNLGEFLPEAVRSVENQTYKNFDLIIVNDGSTDELSLKVLDQYRDKYTVFDKENGGLPQTRNYAIGKYENPFITCLDADDTYEPEFLEKSLKVLKGSSGLGFVTTWAKFFDQKNGVWETSSYNPEKLLSENCIHVASMFKRECWVKVNGYNEKMVGYQDWDFWLSLLNQGYKWDVITEPLFNYRVRKNSMVKGSDSKRQKLLSQIVEKHRDLYMKYLPEYILLVDKQKQEMIKKYESLELVQRSTEDLIKEKDKIINEMDAVISEYWQLKQSKFFKYYQKAKKFLPIK